MPSRSLLARIAGVLLLSTSVLLVLLLLGFLFVSATLVPVMGRTDIWSWPRVLILSVLLTVLGVMALTAIGMLEQKKLVVLYLRRFGRSTNAIDPHYRKGLGGNIRLVTLEDARFRPYGISPREWRIAIGAPLFSILFLVGLSGWAVRSLLGNLDEDNEGSWISYAFFLGYWTWMFTSVILAFSFYQWYLKHTKIIRIDNKNGLGRMASSVCWMSSALLKPTVLMRRSTVVRVTDEFWRDAVVELTASTQVVIVDVSDPTDNVRWELAMLAKTQTPFITIAEASCASNSAALATPLLYDLHAVDGIEAFRSLLLSRLRNQAGSRMPALDAACKGRRLGAILIPLALAFGGYVLALLIAAIVSPLYLVIAHL